MRTTFPFGSRPMPWDRNPTVINLSSTASVAPAGATLRWSYQVPAGRKAILNHVYCGIIRDNAPTTAGLAQAFVRITPSGGGTRTILRAAILTSTVGERDHEVADTEVLMSAGDLIEGLTWDTSTGGTTNYLLAALLTEFDA